MQKDEIASSGILITAVLFAFQGCARERASERDRHPKYRPQRLTPGQAVFFFR